MKILFIIKWLSNPSHGLSYLSLLNLRWKLKLYPRKVAITRSMRKVCTQGGRGLVNPWVHKVLWESHCSECPKSLHIWAELSLAWKISFKKRCEFLYWWGTEMSEINLQNKAFNLSWCCSCSSYLKTQTSGKKPLKPIWKLENSALCGTILMVFQGEQGL